MKKFLFLIFIFTIVPVYTFSQDSTNNSKLFEVYEKSFNKFEMTFFQAKRILMGKVEYLDSIIDDISLAQLTPDELRLLRNSIYAKYGRIFSSKDLTDYFSKFSWYIPKKKNVDSLLTEIDKINIEKILLFENAYNNPKSVTINKKDLTDPWCETVTMPADWPKTFIFESNDSVKYFISKETPLKIFSGFGASYSLTQNKGFLTLNVTEIYFTNHSNEYDEYFGSFWWNSTDGENIVSLSKPIVLNLPISSISELSFGNGELKRNTIMIGSQNFYQYEGCKYE